MEFPPDTSSLVEPRPSSFLAADSIAMPTSLCRTIAFVVTGLLANCLAIHPPCIADEFTADQLEFFEREVRPLLAAKCFGCHSQTSEVAEGGLKLDSREAVLAGGDSGPAAAPHDLEGSLLLTAISYEGGLDMPPSEPLSAIQQQTLRRWIEMGMPWSTTTVSAEGFDLQARRETHWAWQPPQQTLPPTTTNTTWSQGPIDQFILSKLEQHELTPADATDRGTFLRRMSLDLIGLPPTVQQIEQYENDPSPMATVRQVDRLLTDPQFGVRWGRHWLDLVRYAETYGHEFDYGIPHVVSFRDWVINALNEDLPYDQFAVEQLAGDLLEEPRRDPVDGRNLSVVGSGFWWLGDAVHAPVDVLGDQHVRVDNQIDVASKAFQAMTVSCARCHDHKFDAISQADYYALAGLLHSSTRTTEWLDPQQTVETGFTEIQHLLSELHANILPLLEPLPKSAQQETAADVLFNFADPNAPRGTQVGWAFEPAAEQPFSVRLRGDLNQAPQVTIEPAGWLDSGRFGPKARGIWRSAPFEIKTAALAYRVIGDGGGEVRLVIDGHFMIDFHQLLFGGTKFNPNTEGQWRWHEQRGDLHHYIGHTAHIEIIDGGDGYVGLSEVRWLADGQRAPANEESAGHSLPLPWNEIETAARPIVNRWIEITNRLALPQPVLATAPLVARDIPLAIRGNPHESGPMVPRGDLTALSNETADIDCRLDLAKNWAAAKNPLFARVAVNRLWHHLTGRGIVASCDNFGVLGDVPTNLPLLDYMAIDFADAGWSLKRQLREILLSQAYRMQSIPSPAAKALDPANELFHSMPVRRLQGEAIRDSALQLAGKLDRQFGGPPVAIHLTEQMTGRGRPGHNGPLDGNGRRSIFVEIRRNFLSPMMLAFDTPPPFTSVGKRNTSNVPSQALVMLNDPLMRQCSTAWASRILQEPLADDNARIRQMYLEAFGRQPEPTELNTAAAFIQQANETQWAEAWRELAHALFNVKEFIFLP